MAKYNQDWDDLGRNIQNIVDQAINSHDYQKLNQTIRQTVETVVDLGGEVVRKTRNNTVHTASYQEVNRSAQTQERNLPILYSGTGGKTTGGIVKIVGGGLLAGVCFLILLGLAAFNWIFVNTGLVPLLLSLAGFGGGVALICGGINTLGRISRFKTYVKTLGQKTQCSLEKLAASVGKNVKFVRRDVQKMIREGMFLQGHMDKEQTCLITSHETYQLFEQSRLQLEERQRLEAEEKARFAAAKTANQKDSRVQEVLDKGNAFIAEIRRCNDAIPGEEISAKIDRMENLVRRIFQRAEEHPEIVPDLKKMMDYYLPMTVKLLNAYADMDAQPIQGENIESSKREIEQTLDTLNLAFEKLLDDLFKDTALDVSSDISVLQTLLAQEGLTEDDFTKMKNKQNA